MQILFGRINIRFGYPDFDDEDIVITVHLEWNLIFFAREDGTIIVYNMVRKKVMSSLSVSFGMVDIPLKKVHLQTILSSLCSLVLGFISRAVNKVAFDVSFCHTF